MYYMKVKDDESQDLIYYCRFCGHEDSTLMNGQAIKVYKYEKETKVKINHVNEYTKYDPTLPHVTNIQCPNSDCGSNTGQKPVDTVSIRYDNKNMKYLYLCYHCDTQWKA